MPYMTSLPPVNQCSTCTVCYALTSAIFTLAMYYDDIRHSRCDTCAFKTRKAGCCNDNQTYGTRAVYTIFAAMTAAPYNHAVVR